MNLIHTSTRLDVRSLVLATFATACMGLISANSRAADEAPGYEPPKKVVQYGDLNLANSQGVERLYRRIAAAAQQVCGNGETRSLNEKAYVWICTEQSIRRAVAAVDHPALTALYAKKTGRPADLAGQLAKR
ncbi:MAG TPA: UrcA family protein [Steroidobacteraceae bacterium]